MTKTIVVIGGGIAGISTIEGLLQDYDENEPPYSSIVLISASKLVKRVGNYEKTGRNLERFDVTEQSVDKLDFNIPKDLKFKTIIGSVEKVDTDEKIVHYSEHSGDTSTLAYDLLCICNGSSPRRLQYSCSASNKKEVDDRIIVIRDIDTVHSLRAKLRDCRRLAIVGNGGISLELVSRISKCEKVWLVRDDFIGSTFFDSGAAKFLLESVTQEGHSSTLPVKQRVLYSADEAREGVSGPALGPNWLQNMELIGRSTESHPLDIVYNDEISTISHTNREGEYPLEIETKKGKILRVDLIASAIGVHPNKLQATGKSSIEMSKQDEGILVDEQMRTNIESIYAAGDAVSCEKWPTNRLWFQMRLWTQARLMGFYAGRCIVAHLQGKDPCVYANFDCFTHCTWFFGFKVTLLGRFNGQQLAVEDKDDSAKRCEVLVRVDPGKDYVKVILVDGKIVGAVLVGDSGLEETIENLIHDEIDVSSYKEQLLDNTIDIEDYFD